MGCAGNSAIQTPTLDQIAKNGVRFQNAYSECPVCIPARRTIMTGTTPRTHGDRTFQITAPMPELPTMPQTFRSAGYQATAVGKLHVYPQRDRIGFDEVILAEEGRPQWGVTDDYEIFLSDQGYAGRQFEHGMGNNEYVARTWHLPEDTHVTNWLTREMCRTIRRRDPTRPSFWYLSYTHPHPPLVPTEFYWNLYDENDLPEPDIGDWAHNFADLPYRLKLQQHGLDERLARLARRAFYALCTQIDHQLRIVIGTLREEGVLDDTILLFTADHGDMLGTHNLWAKRLFYEQSANVPMLLVGAKGDTRVPAGTVDDRLVGWQDVMPTLCELAGVDAPKTVDGQSMVSTASRDFLYGESNEGATATRMIRSGNLKLIYYAAGNRLQLFDLESDPQELHDVSESSDYAEQLSALTQRLVGEFYGSDLDWLKDGELVGIEAPEYRELPNRGLALQRGIHFPQPQHMAVEHPWEDSDTRAEK